MRGLVVVLMAFGVVVMGNAALTMHSSRRIPVEHGTGSLIGTGTLAISVAAFLYFIWLFSQSLRTAIREWPTAPSSEMTPRNLCARFSEAFTEPAKDVNPAYRYGMLAFCFMLLAWDVQWHLRLSPGYPYERYGNTVVGLMLLLNHLAYSFRWPVKITVALRVCDWCWIGAGIIYLLRVSL